MRKSLEFSSWVESDLDTIADYIAEDSPERADLFLSEIEQKILRIAEQPLLYQLRPDLGEGTRLATVGRHVILFRILGEVVRIERMVYGGRDLPSLLH
jgi:toxin ParE1/3/4